MKILALETSGTSGSVAALLGGEVLCEAELDPRQRSAQSLAPAIRDLLTRVGWRPAAIELIALPIGPGSFTGLRVGVMTAKTLAYATGAQVLGIGTLEVIASRAPVELRSVTVVLDAQRKQIFAQRFERSNDGQMAMCGELEILDIEPWLAALPSDTVLSGPMLGRLADRIPQSVTTVDAACWQPMASATGLLAARRFAQGRRDDLWTLSPRYHRRSAAEEKRDAQ